jgi:dephospho-CoA kinase
VKIIGLTGPIAAGKNEVARILRRLGADVIEVDELAHTLYGAQTPAWSAIVRAFGSKVLKRGGEINRKKLGEIVFADKKQLKNLNSIIHPRLKEEVQKLIASFKLPITSENNGKRGTGNGKRLVVINAAVLKEIGLIDLVDEVWVVLASRELRLKRLLKTGFSKEEASQRINAQVPQQEYLKMADLVIRNDGTIKQLNEKVRAGLKL